MTMKKTDYLYIGADIHKESHTAVLMDYMEEKLGTITIKNNQAGYRRLFAYVEKMRGDLIPMYGLEDVTHYGRNLTIFLQGQEYLVKEVNSALSHMERESFATVKKNDAWDAQCICSVLIRRQDKLPEAKPQDFYWTLRYLVNRRDALVKANVKLIQQFHDQIENVYPSYKKFFREIECPTSMAFFEEYPSPSHLKGVSEEELAAFLRVPSHNACSTNRAIRILALVEKNAINERDYQYARNGVIQSIIRTIRFNQKEIARIEEVETDMLKEVDYQLETIPGVATVTAAALIAQIGDISRFKNADRLANYAGVAPLYKGSAGKGRHYKNKLLGNRELYDVLYFLAIQQIAIDKIEGARNPEMRAYFEYKVFHRKNKDTALICIMRRLIRIIYSMKYKTAYVIPEIKTEPKEQMIS